MRVGVVGLGKLGLPVALALEHAGHELYGWDSSPDRLAQIHLRRVPESEHEPLLGEYLSATRLQIEPHLSLPKPEIVLVCVQTPHEPRFEGVTPLVDEPEDFDYAWLRNAVRDLAAEVRAEPDWDPLVVVVSTCLPGTFDRELRPITDGLRVAYHPLFIAMGSVIDDFRNPEFVLVGCDGDTPGELVEMYDPVVRNWFPLCPMSITSAELTKVAYNAFLGLKLLMANGIAQTCDAVGANADDVMGTLKLATKRLVSTAYLTPGMGDGGGCHPRDAIALSWLAREIGQEYDPYTVVVRAREAHARWLADLWIDEAEKCGLSPVMLGEAYKPNSTLTTGSHARLVAHYARERAEIRVVDSREDVRPGLACWFLATPHDWILESRPRGVMIDPWGVFPERDDLKIVRPGRRA